MDRDTEIALLEELKELRAAGSFFLDDTIAYSPVERYHSPTRFAAEQRAIFRGKPLVAAHGSELAKPGDFLTRDLSGLPILLTRDRDGAVHAFLNVCRHRGMRLVPEAGGCKHLFSCPYHGWTYSNSGALRGIPHQEAGFPDLDREGYGLRRLPAAERAGLILVCANPEARAVDFDGFIAPFADEFRWFDMAGLTVAHRDVIDCHANWKLLAEAGLESYHFKVAHRDTIGPHFHDNLSSYQMCGPHIRSVLARTTTDSLPAERGEPWSIRAHTNVLFTLFPNSQFILTQDHVAWMVFEPVSEARTTIILTTLVPATEATPDKAEHWRRNHKISCATLGEDFEIAAQVQAGFASGANDLLTFGRYEGALDRFNREVEAALIPR